MLLPTDQTGIESSTLNIKSEDLNEAIRKAAAEHLLKRQSAPKIVIPQQSMMKSELERALDARLRRASMPVPSNHNNPVSSANEPQHPTPAQIINKLELPPPPSPHSLHRLASTTTTTNGIIPPPPPLPGDLFSATTTKTSTQPIGGSGIVTVVQHAAAEKPKLAVQQQHHHNHTPNANVQQPSVRSIVNSMHNQIADPRLSSDFGALIGTGQCFIHKEIK